MKKLFKNRFGERKNHFTYHSREYYLKKSKDGEIYAVDSEGNIVADLLRDGDEVIAKVKEKQKERVQNYSGKVKPLIRNGKIQNLDEMQHRHEDASL